MQRDVQFSHGQIRGGKDDTWVVRLVDEEGAQREGYIHMAIAVRKLWEALKTSLPDKEHWSEPEFKSDQRNKMALNSKYKQIIVYGLLFTCSFLIECMVL